MNELSELIRREISAHGAMPFARFMELALYHPRYGYYEQEAHRIGRDGDFYTSVSVGPLFGELLAFQLTEWLNELGSEPCRGALPQADLAANEPPVESGRPTFQLVEAGAHDGQLARDILSWLRNKRPERIAQLEYWIIEPSENRQRRQAKTLEAFYGKVRWFKRWDELPSPVRGVIFSNELMDAFPLHRLGWDAAGHRWFEWGVEINGDRFEWAALSATSPALAGSDEYRRLLELPPELLAVLPDGFTVELAPDASRWWGEAAGALLGGKLMTVDYGLTDHQMFLPQRSSGTLRAYRKHGLVSDPLADPGEQDLTAHVNFSALQRAGERAGLKTDGLLSQARFFARLAERGWQNGIALDGWSAEEKRQFQTLIHPEHLGRSFSALVQSR